MIAPRAALVVAILLTLWSGAHVDAHAQVDAVAVAARDIPRGATLEAEDIAVMDGAAADSRGPVGWTTRRLVKEGEPLKTPAIAPAEVIKSGDEVQLVWSDGAVELRISGRAMNSASVGGTVNVRVDTKRRFEGVALATGEVRLDSPESGRSR